MFNNPDPAMRSKMRAPREPELSCKGWDQEAALRLLMNSLDEELATRSSSAAVSSAAEQLHAVVHSLRALEHDETLLVCEGRAAGVFQTNQSAARVLVVAGVNSHEVRDTRVLAFARTVAGSWLYIGLQELVHLFCEILLYAGVQRLRGANGNATPDASNELAGKLIVSGGMGRMGGALAVAATMAGAAVLAIEIDSDRIKQRLRSGQCDFMVNSVDEALRILKNAVRKQENICVALVGNCAVVMPQLADRGVVPDIITDTTPVRDAAHCVPMGLNLPAALELRARDGEAHEQRARESVARHIEAILRMQSMGSTVLDLGNGLSELDHEIENKQIENKLGRTISGGEVLRQLYSLRSPLRYLALSGAASDIASLDQLASQLFPQHKRLQWWIESARQRLRFQGLPARVCWLGYAEQLELALAINRLVAERKLKGPIALSRDRLDCGLPDELTAECAESAASNGERPASQVQAHAQQLMRALRNSAHGASLIVFRHGAGNCCLQSMMVADGSESTARRIENWCSRDAGLRGSA